MRLVILILLIVVVGGGTLLLTRTWLSMQNQPVETAAPITVEEDADLFVLVADRPVGIGDLLERNAVRWQPWPDDETPPTYYRWEEGDGDIEAAVAPLLGSVSTKNFLEGEPILSSALVDPGERGFLAAVLRPGYRAVTVDVSNARALAGLLHPGDFVDVVLNHTFTETRIRLDTGEEEDIDHQVAETLYTGMRVLAVNTALTQANRDGEPETVTLEGTPQQVESITVADRMGAISLTLNGIREPDALREEQLRIAGLTDRPAGTGGTTAGGAILSGGGAVGAGGDPDRTAPGPRETERGGPLGTPTPADLLLAAAADPRAESRLVDLRREIELALNATPANLGMRPTLLRDPHMPVWQLERLMRRATQTSSLSSDVSLFLTPPVSPVETMANLQDMAPSAETMDEAGDGIMVFRGAPPGGGGSGSVETVDGNGDQPN